MAQPYQLKAATDADGVLRIADQAHIPNDGGNRDWQEYQAWCDDGNVADPAPPLPEIVPVPDPNARLDSGVDAAVTAYHELTPPDAPAQQPGGQGGMSVEERLLRLEESLKALCNGHMASGKPAGF